MEPSKATAGDALPTIEVVVVPYEVERDDTGMARGPEGLIRGGLLDLGDRVAVRRTDIWSRLEPDGSNRTEVVARLALSTARAVASARGRGRFPVVLAGGCLSAIGVVAGLQRLGRDLAAIWLDAHGDFNTPESSPSGYWDGMALAAVCGRCLPDIEREVELRPLHPGKVAHLAGRAFDPPEIEDFERLSVALVPPADVGSAAGRHSLDRIDPAASEVYLHLDLDGLDPSEAPAVRLPTPGGPSAEDLARCLAGAGPFAAVTIAGADFEHADAQAHRRTVETCRNLLRSLVLPRLVD